MIIYLAKQLGTSFYKIGISRSPNIRIKHLQTGNPNEIVIIETNTTKYSYKLEQALHKHFKVKQYNSEWFELNNEDVENFTNTCRKYELSFDALKDNTFFDI